MVAHNGVRGARRMAVAMAVAVVVPLLTASALAPFRHSTGVSPAAAALAYGDEKDGSSDGDGDASILGADSAAPPAAECLEPADRPKLPFEPDVVSMPGTFGADVDCGLATGIDSAFHTERSGPLPDFECQTKPADPGRNDSCPAWAAAPSTENLDGGRGAAVLASGDQLYIVSTITLVPDDDMPGGSQRVPGMTAFSTETGSVVWTFRYEGTEAEPHGEIHELANSPDGSVVYAAAGTWSPNLMDAHPVVLAVDAANGELLWERHPTDDSGLFWDIALSADASQLALTGFVLRVTPSGSTPRMMITMSLDPATGELLWDTVTADTAMRGAVGYQIVAAPVSPTEAAEPAFYIAGATVSKYHGDIVMAAYSASGDELWTGRHIRDGDQNAGPSELLVTPDGRRLVFLASAILWDGVDISAFKAMTVAVDAAGGEAVWEAIEGADGEVIYAGGFHAGPGLALDPTAGQVYSIAAADGKHLHTFAYRLSDGARIWSESFADRFQVGVVNATHGQEPMAAITVNPAKRQLHVLVYSFDPNIEPNEIGQTEKHRWTLMVTYNTTTGEKIAVSRFGAWWQQQPAWSAIGINFIYENLQERQRLWPIGVAALSNGNRIFAAGHIESDSAMEQVLGVRKIDIGAVAWETPADG